MNTQEQQINERQIWPSSLATIYDVLLSEFKRKHPKLTEEMRHELVKAVVLGISEHCGGADFYLPKGQSIHLAIRNSEIFSLRNELTTRELA
ncbi:Mor transcription activator family protein [Photobacterium nomapromontoriensis]|uniref:Mor transcription activator family protein n=1 Tax=Photobacterium nomapromontoriensis TaxID=2910237 RepID=UPI003D0CE9FD